MTPTVPLDEEQRATLAALADDVRRMAISISRNWAKRLTTVEDVVQEGFIAAAIAIRAFETGKGTLEGFVFFCMRRHFHELSARLRVRQHCWRQVETDIASNDLNAMPEQADYRSLPQSELAAWYDEDFLRCRREVMPLWMRVVLYLYCVEGISRRELGVLFAVPTNRIRDTITEARRICESYRTRNDYRCAS